VIDHRLVVEVVEQRVDREVAPQRVLLGCAELVVVADQQVTRFRVLLPVIVVAVPRAEGGDLDDLAVVKVDVRQPEAAADDPRVAEHALDLPRRCRGGDVEILGLPLQQQVADTPTHEVGLVVETGETLDDLDRVGVQVGVGDRPMHHPRTVVNRRSVGSACGVSRLAVAAKKIP